ncbi:hypothetical protein D3C71_1329470 [compost metagenome]
MSITPLSSAEYTSPVGSGVTDTPMAPITAEARPTKRPFLPVRSAILRIGTLECSGSWPYTVGAM